MNTVHIPPTRRMPMSSRNGHRARRYLAVTALVAAAVSLSGCSVSLHPTVSADTLEQTVSDRLYDIVGQRPDAIDCPDELDGVVGTTLQCQLTTGSDRYPVTLTVTGVEGQNVNFDFEVADQPLTRP